jgi:5'(3')-deoxyribonucleotidase
MSTELPRKAIAVDLDDVLAAHVEAFIAFSNENYGTNLKTEDYNDFWVHIWQVEQEEIERRKAQFHTEESVAAFKFKEEARTVLAALSQDFDLYIVTARPQGLIETTHKWIERNLPGVFKGIHFVPIWEPNNQINKANICRSIGAGYLIDDMPRHCNVVAEGGMKAILFGDYGWNRNEDLAEGVVRCKDWKEVLTYFGL